MPNHVINEIKLYGSDEEIQAVLEAVKKDSIGIGTIDFNKLLPIPPELNIEAGSRTDRGLKHYRDFVEVFTLGGTMNTEKLASIPKKSEAAFLRQRPDILTDEWELGKVAWNNIRRFGAPTWYEWFIAHGVRNGIPTAWRNPSFRRTIAASASKPHNLRRIPF